MTEKSRVEKLALDQRCLQSPIHRSGLKSQDDALRSTLPAESLSASQSRTSKARPVLLVLANAGAVLAEMRWRTRAEQLLAPHAARATCPRHSHAAQSAKAPVETLPEPCRSKV